MSDDARPSWPTAGGLASGCPLLLAMSGSDLRLALILLNPASTPVTRPCELGRLGEEEEDIAPSPLSPGASRLIRLKGPSSSETVVARGEDDEDVVSRGVTGEGEGGASTSGSTWLRRGGWDESSGSARGDPALLGESTLDRTVLLPMLPGRCAAVYRCPPAERGDDGPGYICPVPAAFLPCPSFRQHKPL